MLTAQRFMLVDAHGKTRGEFNVTRRGVAEIAVYDGSGTLRAGLGDFFVDYYVKLKQAEIDRFSKGADDWEQREYFSIF